MLNYIFFCTVSFVIAGILFYLIQQNRKLKQALFVLSQTVEAMKGDVAGLCSAAVSVDKRLIDNNEQLIDVAEKVIDFEKNDNQIQTSQPYHSAIQKVRNGATVDELIQQCGLSREEATLLMRLHGHRES